MKLLQSTTKFKVNGIHKPHTITLHHTAGSIKGSVPYLADRGFGYHFMIAKAKDVVHVFNPVKDIVSHSYKANNGYIGISYEAGGTLGPVSEEQILTSIELITDLVKTCKSIVMITDHASVDKIIANRGAKSDPFWSGEKSEVNNWVIKHNNLVRIANAVKLKAISYMP